MLRKGNRLLVGGLSLDYACYIRILSYIKFSLYYIYLYNWIKKNPFSLTSPQKIKKIKKIKGKRELWSSIYKAWKSLQGQHGESEQVERSSNCGIRTFWMGFTKWVILLTGFLLFSIWVLLFFFFFFF